MIFEHRDLSYCVIPADYKFLEASKETHQQELDLGLVKEHFSGRKETCAQVPSLQDKGFYTSFLLWHFCSYRCAVPSVYSPDVQGDSYCACHCGICI